ncbi:hypothetical protein GQS52_03285 [Streptomyces sp. SCUT-3]|uniref:hypothetical protein n=1 Tax=Streptomyces sp. SCUT-3 TaxID=2684469 RepID=UPI000CB0A57F|nr:hypothetical protein [Streptomyces sp. SCUT-3]PLW71686.1 hypothetical protein C0036_16540 [Streptomyces sp. DJ]QMV20966.1 hypothetical protein GQS52_03285 [Streptomyces sp. SCUT-3]
MRLLTTKPRMRPRHAAALAAAAAAVAVLAPMAVTGPDTVQAAPAADVQEAPAADPSRLLGTPGDPRVSDGPYETFQLCGSPGGEPLVTAANPVLAATLESVAPPGTPEQPPGNANGSGWKVTFEVDGPAGKQVVRKTTRSRAGHTAVLQIPEGRLSDGAHRWRVRVKDESATSEWTEWCDFTVRLSGKS